MKKIKILGVEDNHEDLCLLDTMLSSKGYEVVLARDGQEALEKLEEGDFDMIISDVVMPRKDGFHFCLECKKDRRFRGIPFVFYTATYTGLKDEELATKFGAALFLVKPIEPDQLLGKIDDILKSQKERNPVTRSLDEKEVLDSMKAYNDLLVAKLEEKVISQNKLMQETKKLEAETQQALNDWKLTFDSIGDMVSIHDKDFKILNMNKAMLNALKIKLEEIIGKKCWEVVHGTNEPLSTCIYKRVLESKKTEKIEYFDARLGAHLSLSMSPRLNEANEVIGTVHVIEDISKRRENEEALKAREAFSDTLFNTAQVIMLVLDKEGRIVRFNSYMEKLAGYALSEVKGKNWFETFIPKSDQIEIKAVFSNALNSFSTKGKINPIIRKDGIERDIEWYDEILKDSDGNIIGVLAVGQDITKRLKMEADLKKHLHELEVFYKSSRGREERILELKEKVKMLETQLGQKGSE